jgi:5-methylcytosine-specific restriction protein A
MDLVAYRSDTGKSLNRKWNVNARHALYHREGTWYHVLTEFPGAYFDPEGYILFKTEADYLNCRDIEIGRHANIRCGISRLARYVHVRLP